MEYQIKTFILFRGSNIDFGWKSSDNENNRVQNDTSSFVLPETVHNRQYENVFIAYATVPGMI